ncbi:MAG: ferritin-like domain-containing protein [Cyanobacteria bacterium P01_H01_bin.58]
MSATKTLQQTYGEIANNPVLLDQSVTAPVLEGLGIVHASFVALSLQYQKHHFVVEGSEYHMLHDYFLESYEAAEKHAHDLGERLHGLGGVPAISFGKLAELCCFEPESDDIFRCQLMIEHDLEAERSLIEVLRRQATQAESLGDRATRYLYEQTLLKTEERAYHLEHFLTRDSLKLTW